MADTQEARREGVSNEGDILIEGAIVVLGRNDPS